MESIIDLPLEIKVLIAEHAPQIFRIFHTYDPEVRQFINERLDKYKKRFSKEIVEYSFFGDKIKYYILPNGYRHGLFKQWRSDGLLRVECTYKDGKKEGLYRAWRANGQLFSECTYKDGVIINI